jgi:ribosome-associated translation inhibitor RaiA
MDNELLARMRGRAEQVRRVMNMAHDPRMIEALQKVIDEIEADIRRLETRSKAGR